MYGLKKAEFAPQQKYAGMIALYGVAYVILTGLVMMLFADTIPYLANASLLYIVMLLIAGFAAMFFGMTIYRRRFPSGDRINIIIIGVVSIIAVQFASQIVGALFFTVIPFSPYSVGLIPTNILFFIVITQAPIAEEFLFSGFAQTGLLTSIKQLNIKGFEFLRTPLIIGVLAALFALYHGRVYASNLPALASVFIGRVVYSICYEYTDSLDIPIMLHMINNIMAGVPILLTMW